MSAQGKSEALREQATERTDKRDDIEATAANAPEYQSADDFNDEDADDDVEAEASRDAAQGYRRGAASARLFDSLPASPHVWNTVVIACLLAAIVLLLTGHTDATFVLATLGLVAWFINMRNRLRDGDVQTGDMEEPAEAADEGNFDGDE